MLIFLKETFTARNKSLTLKPGSSTLE